MSIVICFSLVCILHHFSGCCFYCINHATIRNSTRTRPAQWQAGLHGGFVFMALYTSHLLLVHVHAKSRKTSLQSWYSLFYYARCESVVPSYAEKPSNINQLSMLVRQPDQIASPQFSRSFSALSEWEAEWSEWILTPNLRQQYCNIIALSLWQTVIPHV